MKQETKLEIYPSRPEYAARTKEKLNNSSINQPNKKMVLLYEQYLTSTGKSKSLRIAKLISQMRQISEWLETLPVQNQWLNSLTKTDILCLVAHINNQTKLSPVTRADYRRTLKQFYKWFKDEDPRLETEQKKEAEKFYKFLEKEVSSDSKVIQADPRTIITEEEIHHIIDKGALMPKEKAFLSLLHETGCRAAEFLNLHIADITLKEDYLEIHVPDGKTGPRVIYAVKSLPHVLRYLDGHPLKDNSSAFLWICESSKHKHQPLLHIGGQKLIDRCFDRAGLGIIKDEKTNKNVSNPKYKKHNWHWFRHSRATILAPKMTEVMLCKYMGWVIGSRQIKRYVHLCNSQIENVFLEINGLKKPETEENKLLKCICGTLNHPKERYCFKCYKPLSVAVAIQDSSHEIKEMKILHEETMKTMHFLMDMAKNPELMRQFEDFKREKSL